MAIIQISQIKHRRGSVTDLPFELEEGEIGLAIDTGEVFIGTPTLPAAINRSPTSALANFPYRNTQILTEWTENVEQLINYQYKSRQVLLDNINLEFQIGGGTANPILTYVNSNNDIVSSIVSRKLQERLDEIVSVKSYGATGNARRDFSVLPSNGAMNAETAALRRAALDVVNVTNNPGEDAGWKPRALHYPAGVYCTNNSLFLPPNSTWLGDGKGKSIVALCESPGVSVIPGQNDCLVFTVDGGLNPEDFNNTGAIGQHSYQNIGTAVSAGNDLLPDNIIVAGITFIIQRDNPAVNTPLDIIRLISSKNVIFYDCEFIGNWDDDGFGTEVKGAANGEFYFPGNLGNNGDSIAVTIDSGSPILDALKSRNISFVNCDFSNTTYASLLNDDMQNIAYSLCTFNRHYRAIAVSEPLATNPAKVITQGSAGPRFVSLDRNYFTNITREGISVNAVGLTNNRDDADIEFNGAAGVVSTFNRFENVGNGNTNNGLLDFPTNNLVTPTYPVIRFSQGTMNNASIGDNFSRDSIPERTNGIYGVAVPRVQSSPLDSNLVINSQDFAVNPVRQLVFIPAVDTTTGLRFAQDSNNSIFINYTLTRDGTNDKRIGTMRIIGTDSPAVYLDDDYSEIGTPIDASFSVNTDGATIDLLYTNNDADDLILYYQINNWTTQG